MFIVHVWYVCTDVKLKEAVIISILQAGEKVQVLSATACPIEHE